VGTFEACIFLMRTMIISQPKAGTYLCANLLKEFGLTQLPMHLSEWRYEIYQENKLYRRIQKPFLETIKRVKDNQFAVTHISATTEFYEGLRDFKKIIVLRPLEERLESWHRFTGVAPAKLWSHETKWNAHNGKNHWQKQKGCFVIEFKDLKECNVKKIDKMQRYLFGRIHHDSKVCIEAALQKDSLTKFTKK
jgi:hypothetical protein